MPSYDGFLVQQCICCGRNTNAINPMVMTYNGETVCSSCTTACHRLGCGQLHLTQNLYPVGDELWCRNCTVSQTIECYSCNLRKPKVEGIDGFAGFTRVGRLNRVCDDCLLSYYWTCCAEFPVRRNQNCEKCEKDERGNKRRCRCMRGTVDRPIHEYSCKPTLVFHGKSKDKIHMGFELETQIANGNSESSIRNAAVYAMEMLQPPEIAELKQDSSIGGGFEIVTQPHTYEKYRDDSAVLWDTIDTLRTDYKARSWDAGTCGLHIHVSRNAFRDGLHTHMFIELIYRNPEMLMKFAGRRSTNYATFSDCWGTDEYDQPTFNIDDKLKKNGNTVRGSAVNTNNANTLELRFFRGTMKPSGVLSALGLVHSMVQYTRHMVPDVNAKREQVFAWEPFAVWVEEHAEEYPDLMKRMPLIKDVNLKNVPNIDA